MLIVGGHADDESALDPETFDPASGEWVTMTRMIKPRERHVALFAQGTVFVIGGANAAGNPLAATERFDPGGGTWTATAPMLKRREDHTATLLRAGAVLVTGGRSSGDFSAGLRSAERYDPATGSWVATAAMPAWRYAHTATRLRDGTVLVVGGSGQDGMVAKAALYDPGTEP